MPSDLANYFIDVHKPIIKMTYVVNESDYDFIKSVFLEHGFMAYFPGYSLKLLADSLHRNGIHSFHDRLKTAALVSPAALSLVAKEAWEKTILINPQQYVHPKQNSAIH
jgi:hypothetical protein